MRHLLMIFVVVFLALFSANAKADLVGVDFGPPGQATPTNWTSVSGAGTYNNLGTETGQSTAVGLQVTGNVGGDPISSAAGVNPATIPNHSNSLANIGGNIYRFVQQQPAQLGLRIFNLEPSTSYNLWVFGLSDGDFGVNQTVSGAITFNQTGLSQDLVVNDSLGSSANDLSVYSLSATADGSGEINITVTSNPDLYAVAGLAIDVPAVPPTFTKSFSPDTITYGGTSTLTFTIDNSGSLGDATNLDFTDNLPAGVTIANPANASTTCTGGTLTAVAGTGVISYTGGSLAAGGTCTLQADVTSTTAGTHNNTSGDLTSNLGNSGPASASLTVGTSVPPNFSKAFSPNSIANGGTSTLTFTIDNSGSLVDATNLDFTDNLPAGVTIANPANASTTCTGGTLTAVAGTGVISYTGGSLAAGGTCTLQADVTSTTAGTHSNTSGDLTSNLGNSGPASDSLTVEAEPIPTLNEWGVMVLAVFLGLSAFWFLRRKKPSLRL